MYQQVYYKHSDRFMKGEEIFQVGVSINKTLFSGQTGTLH